MRRAYYLGIDGGGTGCRARLADADGRTLGSGAGGPANLTLAVEVAARSIDAAIDAALKDAGLPATILGETRAGMGLAGANVPELAARLAALPFPFASLAVASDAEVACLGAFDGEDGAILILGTGSHGVAFVGGKTTAIGGWGFQLSDDGSGAILGRSALRAAIRAFDGLSPKSPLTEAILARFDGKPHEAVQWALSARPTDYAAFAPLVLDRLGRGDAVARTLIDETVAGVAGLVDRLLALGSGRVALMGGLAAPLAPHLPDRLKPFLVAPLGDALDGALRLARSRERAGSAA